MSLVADVPLDAEVDAKTNAAVGIARAFSFISSEKDSREAFDWLLKVSGTVVDFCGNGFELFDFRHVILNTEGSVTVVALIFQYYSTDLFCFA